MSLSVASWAVGVRDFLVWSFDPRRTRATIFVILLITGLVGASQTGLFDRDEPRYAQAVREMIAGGNWLVPSFNGEPRLHKPILIYWLMAPFYVAFGDSPLAARMPSVVASAISGVLIFSLVQRWWGRRAALWATLVWATAPLTIVQSRMATTDSVLNALILGMMLCLTRLYGGPEAWTARLFWLLTGLSILTKGPIGLLFVAAGLGATRLFAGVRMPRAWLRPAEGAGIVCAVVVPWLAAVTYCTHGDFLRFAVGRELLGRTVAPAEGHSGVPGFYLLMLMPLFLPWSLFLPRTLRQAWSHRKADPRIAFLIGWAFGPLILLELISTKLVHYHFPSYAALAVLVGVELAALEATSLRPNLMAYGRSLGLSVNSWLALGVMAALGIAWAYPVSSLSPCLLIAAVMGYALWLSVSAVREGQWNRVLHASAAAWTICALIIIGWLLPANENSRLSMRVAEAVRRQHGRIDSSLALGEFRDPSLIHSLKSKAPVPVVRRQKDVSELVDRKGAVLMPLSPAELKRVEQMSDIRVQPLDRIEAFDWDRGKRRIIVVCLLTRDPLERLSRLPGVSTRRIAGAEASGVRK
jgi:4-amino-4-deoxy-L-arabinose transferase-like glycosyltransferase